MVYCTLGKKEQEKDLEESVENRRKRVNRIKTALKAAVLVISFLPCLVNLGLLGSIQEYSHLEKKLVGLKQEVIRYLEEQPQPQAEQTVGSDFVQIEDMPSEEVLFEEFSVEELAPLEEENGEKPDSLEGKRRVYLTFDDGPSPYTERILDILDQYGVKATFFVTATQIEGYEEVCKRIVEDGHSLGIHTYNHVYDEIYSSINEFQRDIRKIQNYLYRLTGKVVMIYRFPGGSSNSVSRIPVEEMIEWLEEEGMVYYDWNVAPEGSGSGGLGVQQITANAINGVRRYDPAIILLHDSYEKKSTIEALPPIIEGILELEDTVLLSIDRKTAPIQHISITKE